MTDGSHAVTNSPKSPPERFEIEGLEGAERAGMPRPMAPMLARLTSRAFSDPGWVFEPKIDGIRALAFISEGSVKIYSRKTNDITAHYPEITADLKHLGPDMAVLDGEICALDGEGRPSFQSLQPRMNLSRSQDIQAASLDIPAYYFIFDLLYLDGFDLKNVKLRDRKLLLTQVFSAQKQLRLLDYFSGDGELILYRSFQYGFEGIIAKQLESRYEPGKRSGKWLKIKKVLSDDFIIGGYTPGQGSRKNTFGSLLLGYYNQPGELVYAGNVGTGFDEPARKDLKNRLDGIASAVNPFSTVVDKFPGVQWVKPRMVAEVKFSEWTRDSRLRAPVFMHLRPDKPAAEAKPETRVPDAGSPGSKLSESQELLEQLRGTGDNLRLEIGSYKLSVTNLNKALWPPFGQFPGVTKRDLLIYFTRVYSYIIVHLENRPLTLSRYPDGITGEQFFQKNWAHPLPEFVATVTLPSQNRGEDIRYLMCNNLPSLLWLAQIADLELHTWFSRIDPQPDISPEYEGNRKFLAGYPDFIIFDIDPYIYSGQEKAGQEPQYNRSAFDAGRKVAFILNEKLDLLGLKSFVKTSGRTGLHIFCPIMRQFDYETVRRAAETICTFVVREYPDLVTTEWSVEKRRGKIFLDFNQNVMGKTLASAYSPRPSMGATVSTPLTWQELEKAYPVDFDIFNVADHLESRGDPWSDIIKSKSDLASLLE